MIISLNWLKKYVDLSGVSTEELVKLIGARLVEVESVSDISEKYRGIKVVEVKSVEKIEGSDHLHVCQVIASKAKQSSNELLTTGSRRLKPRDDSQDDNLIQVVCGAPNVRAGMLAVWLPPKTVLPETWNEEPLVLEKRKLMGVESNGMLASARELGLGDEHDGIAEIDPNDAKPGDDFATVFDLNDTLLDIENKSLTHRPDCFGIIGFAREVAGILGQEFVEPKWFKKPAKSVVKNTTKGENG
jgi:phenylalanyl-tRNA synthetase beta chain